MNTALAKRTEKAQTALSFSKNVKDEIDAIKQLAEIYHASGAFPDLKTTAQAFVKIKTGLDLGFSPHVALAGIHFIQGKAVIGANLLASLIKDSGKYEYKVLKNSATECELEFYQRIGTGEWAVMGVPVRYTIQEAQNAALAGKDVWKKFPADMLFAACIRQGTRRYCADVLRGNPIFSNYNDAEGNVDAQLAEAGTFGQSPNIVDGHEANEAAREEAMDALLEVCKELNAIGDETVWSKVALNEYADALLNNSGGIAALNTSAIITVRESLQERLEALRTHPEPAEEIIEGVVEDDNAPIGGGDPTPTDNDESRLEDLRIAAKELYTESEKEQKKAIDKWLGQRTISTLTANELSELLETFSR